jgi:hypothetical protein
MPRVDTPDASRLLASVTMFAQITAQQTRSAAAKGGDERNLVNLRLRELN